MSEALPDLMDELPDDEFYADVPEELASYADRPLPRSAVEGHQWMMELLDNGLAKRVGRMERRLDRYRTALEAIVTIRDGRACYVTQGGIPMEMPKHLERLVRVALRHEEE